MKKLRVGIAGLRRGRVLLQIIADHPKCEVTALAARENSELRGIAKAHGITKAFYDFDELLESDVDVVVLATPPELHAEQAAKAARQGKHVLSEVPGATSVGDLNDLVKAIHSAGVIYGMAGNVLWYPIIQSLVRYVSTGNLGRIFYAESDYFQNLEAYRTVRNSNSGGWRDTISPMIYSTHCVLPLRHLLGDEFTDAYTLAPQAGVGITNRNGMNVALLRTSRGSVAKIAVSWGMQRTYCLYYSLYGTKGTYERSRAEWDKDKIYLSNVPFMNEMMPFPVPFSNLARPLLPSTPRDNYWWKARTKLLRQPPLQMDRSSEVEMVDDFVQAILHKRQPRVNIRETELTTQVGIYASKSAEAGRAMKIPSASSNATS